MSTGTLRSTIEEHELFVREMLPQDAGTIASVKGVSEGPYSFRARSSSASLCAVNPLKGESS
jgi:hypothetical protein